MNYALITRTTYLDQRRQGRSMLIGVLLFVAHAWAQEIRKQLLCGDDDVIEGKSLATTGRPGQYIKLLGRMSPLGILRLVNQPRFEEL